MLNPDSFSVSEQLVEALLALSLMERRGGLGRIWWPSLMGIWVSGGAVACRFCSHKYNSSVKHLLEIGHDIWAGPRPLPHAPSLWFPSQTQTYLPCPAEPPPLTVNACSPTGLSSLAATEQGSVIFSTSINTRTPQNCRICFIY